MVAAHEQKHKKLNEHENANNMARKKRRIGRNEVIKMHSIEEWARIAHMHFTHTINNNSIAYDLWLLILFFFSDLSSAFILCFKCNNKNRNYCHICTPIALCMCVWSIQYGWAAEIRAVSSAQQKELPTVTPQLSMFEI